MAGLDPAISLMDPYCSPERDRGVKLSNYLSSNIFHFLEFKLYCLIMIVIGTEIAERYFAARAGHKGNKAARAQYDAWRVIAATATWRTPEDVKQSHPKASILKAGRVVFNIKGNNYRLVAALSYSAGVLAIRFFGTHAEYEKIDAETV